MHRRDISKMKTVGMWSWRPDLLEKKIVKGQPDDCWEWLGSRGPHAALFGAYKNDKQQMTQAARIIYRNETGLDCEEQEVTHTCNNRYCVNFNHMKIVEHKIHGRPVKQTKPIKQAKIKKLKKWWDI